MLGSIWILGLLAAAANAQGMRPSLPAEAVLDTDALLSVLDPLPPDDGTLDCLTDICGSYGGFIESVVKRCNATALRQGQGQGQGSGPLAPTGDAVRAMLGDCLCGASDGDYESIMAGWQQCVECLAVQPMPPSSSSSSSSSQPPQQQSRLTRSSYPDACACVDPGPVEALLNLANPAFKCRRRVPRTLSRRLRLPRPLSNGPGLTQNASTPTQANSTATAGAAGNATATATATAQPSLAASTSATIVLPTAPAQGPAGLSGIQRINPIDSQADLIDLPQ